MSWLSHPQVLATRRNHALEHATVHLLSQGKDPIHIIGHSNPSGFILFGEVTLEEVRAAAEEALARLRSGQKHLAIHPGCGTNLAVSALSAGLGAWLGMLGTKNNRERADRIPAAGLFAWILLNLSAPLGPWLQKNVTTEADMATLQIKSIQILRTQAPYLYFIRTTQ